MPVVHEKPSPRDNSRESPRERSQNRTVNRNIKREDSLDRKPIISQGKPNRIRNDKLPIKDKRTVPSTSKQSDTKRAEVVKKSNVKQTSLLVKEKVKVIEKAPERTSVPKKKEEKRPQIKREMPVKTIIRLNVNKGKEEKDLKKLENSKVQKTKSRGHDRTITRTLSPSEVTLVPKIVKVGPNTENDSEMAQKPRESDKDAEKDEISEPSQDEYDDDFEDYESDFEEDESTSSESADVTQPETLAVPVPSPSETYEVPTPSLTETREVPSSSTDLQTSASSSTSQTRKLIRSAETHKHEVEKKLDSGSYHLTSQSQRVIDDVKIAIANENRKKEAEKNKDESKSGIVPKSDFVRSNSEILNFANEEKRLKQQEIHIKSKTRGEILSQMITLDTITYTIMEIPPMPYDIFMKSYGRVDTKQAQIQTNEDDCDEEVQTEVIAFDEKWTQMPTQYVPETREDGRQIYRFTKEERLGVGAGNVSSMDENGRVEPVNIGKMNKFLQMAGQRMTIWLEGKGHQHQLASQSNQSSELSCCDEKCKFTLPKAESNEKGRIMKVITSSSNPNIVLAVQKNEDMSSFLHLWTILEPSAPLKTLRCSQDVKCACFGPGRGNLIFGGCHDGSLNLWDLREGPELHPESEAGIGRSTTYSTALMSRNEGHESPIVSVIVLRKTEDNKTEEFTPAQVCTLDNRGTVLLWSAVQHYSIDQRMPNKDLGLAPWGKVRLVKTSGYSVSRIFNRSDIFAQNEQYTFLKSADSMGNGLYIGTSSGRVFHCSTYGVPLKPKMFIPNNNIRHIEATSLVSYPYDNHYLLIGCSDGTIRLHSKHQETPLMTFHWNLSDVTPSSAVLNLQWLPSRPFLFFAIDATSRIHIWNLEQSEVYPQFTVPPSINKITCATILKKKHSTHTGYMVLGREDGSVELHRLKEEFSADSKESFKKQRKLFTRYLSVL